MKRKMDRLKQLTAGLLCLGLLASPLLAKDEPDLMTFFRDLSAAKDVVPHLKGLSNWSDTQLEHRKLEDTLLGLLSDDRLLKNERTSTLKVLSDLAMFKGVIKHDSLAKKLMELLPKVTSPTFQRDAFMTMGQLDGIENGTTLREFSNLVGKIIADAAEPKKNQNYSASLHAEALSIFDAKKVTKSQLETLSNLLKGSDDLSPVLLQGVYRAIMNLGEESPKVFTKREKTGFLKALLEQIESSPGRVVESASESEIDVLLSAITAAGSLLTSEDTLSQLGEGTELMLELFMNEDDRIFMAASDVLLEITKADLPRSKLSLDVVLKPELEKANKKDPKSPRVRLLLGILIELEGYLLKGDLKSSDSRLADLLSILHKTVLTHPEMSIRHRALDGFFVLEPKYFKGKFLNKDGKATLKKFVDGCVGLMANKKMRKAIPELLDRMGSVLFEMTGQDYGSDAKLWGEWLRNEGGDFF